MSSSQIKMIDSSWESSLFENILEATGDGLLIVRSNSTLLDHNTQFLTLWDIQERSALPDSIPKLLDRMSSRVRKPRDFEQQFRERIQDEMTENLDTIELENGRLLEQYTCPVEHGGEHVARVWSYSDITRRERARNRARKVAFQDPLTDLPNRIKFLEYLQGMLLYNRTSDQQAAALCLDLNRFKRINNSIGQDAGDEVLKECVRRWQQVLDDDLLMARTGGDEFMIFVPEYRDRGNLEKLSQNLINALEDPFAINGYEIDVRVNIGIALYPRDSEEVDGLLSMAHRAMEESRKRGINNYQFFLSEMQDQPTDIVSLESDLRDAVENNKLSLHYQPQVELETQKLTGVEALLRWEHPERGMISPKTSIPLAEETGLILPVGEWVLQEACRMLNKWKDIISDPIRMSVNVSAEQIIQERRFLNSVQEILKERDIKPECLEFEITETVALRDLDFTSELLDEFHEMSIQTSVDDFGTGHSTLTYLQELPYDRLKIDRSFIDGLAEERQHRVMVEAMISLAKELKLEVIAEGVETEEQLEILRDLDCDIIQGFYYSKPLPEEDLIPLLEEGSVRAS